MEHWYRYAVLRVCPDPMRGEIINIGLVIISPKGELDIVLPDKMNKAKALDTSLSAEVLAETVQSIGLFTGASEEARVKEELIAMACTSFIRCSPFAGFRLDTPNNYEKKKAELLDLLVRPVSHTQNRPKKPRITTKVKDLFRNKNMLGENASDLDKHLVVPNFVIDQEQGLTADFALKNGAMHITQTIDLMGNLDKKQAEAALNALTLDKAKANLGPTTKCYVVYSVKSATDNRIKQTLSLLRDHTDNLFNLEEEKDTNHYMDLLQQAIASCPPSAMPPSTH